jgi:hypothetical protein
LKEQLALPNERALPIALPEQVACNLCPDIGIDEPIKGADPFTINRNIFLLDLSDLDVRQGRRVGSGSTLWAYRANNQAEDDQAKAKAYGEPELVFRKSVHVHLRSLPLT